jgi:hypothetical protein
MLPLDTWAKANDLVSEKTPGTTEIERVPLGTPLKTNRDPETEFVQLITGLPAGVACENYSCAPPAELVGL